MNKRLVIGIVAGIVVVGISGVVGVVVLIARLFGGSSESSSSSSSSSATTPHEPFQSGVTVMTTDEKMAAFFAETPKAGVPALPAIETLAGKWKGRIVSIDVDDGFGARPDEWPEVSFSIDRARLVPDQGLGAERELKVGSGEYLATAREKPDLHLRLEGDRLIGWIESSQEPKGRMEFHATRTR